jgi:DNA-binding transcriptional regulator YdaS (Cro superfamily)
VAFAMQHSRIIDELSERLGGQVKLAGKLGLSNTTISHWRNDDGIPPRHWPTLLRIAKRAGYRLTLGQLDSGPARPVRNEIKPCEVA